MEESSQLKEKIKKWVNNEGIPLEYFTSSHFMEQGFRVFQSDFVEENGVPREIDINAYIDSQIDTTILRIHCPVECKWTKDKP